MHLYMCITDILTTNKLKDFYYCINSDVINGPCLQEISIKFTQPSCDRSFAACYTQSATMCITGGFWHALRQSTADKNTAVWHYITKCFSDLKLWVKYLGSQLIRVISERRKCLFDGLYLCIYLITDSTHFY